MAGRKIPNWECLFVHREKDYSYLCMWMTYSWLERNRILIRGGKYSTKKSIWENQHPSLIMCTWDALKDNEISKNIVDNYRTMFESRISAERVEKLPFPQNLRISSWSYEMEGRAKKCVERYCELANKTTQQLYKVSTSCIDDHHVKKKKRNLSENCHKYVLNCSKMLILGTNWTT